MKTNGRPRRYGAFDPQASSDFHERVAGRNGVRDASAFPIWADWAEEHGHQAVADAMRSVKPYEHSGEYVFGRMPKAGFLYATDPALEHPKPEWNGQNATLTLLHQNEHGHHLSWPVRGKIEDITALAKRLDDEGVTRLTARPTTQSAMDIFRRMTPAQRLYVDTALWSSNDEADEYGGEPMDRNHGITDLHPQSLARMIAEWEAFKASEHHMLENMTDDQAAHWFWLSRNHHGANFRDWDDPDAEELMRAAQAHRGVNLYIDDDGQIHQDNEWAPLLRHLERSERPPVREQRRLAATRAPAGGMIVREGFRSATPGATYHGGLFYKGGKMLPSVSGGKLPRVKRHNGTGNRESGIGNRQSQQQAARRQRRYSAEEGNADDKTPFQHPRLSEQTNALLASNHRSVVRSPNDAGAHRSYSNVLHGAADELQRAFRIPIGQDAISIKAHDALNEARHRYEWHNQMASALESGYQRDFGAEHWLKRIMRHPEDLSSRMALADYIEENPHHLSGFRDHPEMASIAASRIRAQAEDVRDGGDRLSKVKVPYELAALARMSGLQHLLPSAKFTPVTKFGPRLYRGQRRYAAVPNAHYLHAIMSTGQWEPLLAWAHKLSQAGHPAIADVLRAHHAFAMAHPHMKPGFYGPAGNVGHWEPGMHPEGFSFEANPDMVGWDMGHVKLRHTVSPTQTRHWFMRGMPYDIDKMAQRLRVEGVPELVRGQFVQRTPRQVAADQPLASEPSEPITPDQATRKLVKPKQESAVRKQRSVKKAGPDETYRPSQTLIQMCRS